MQEMNEIVLVNPRGDAEKASALCSAILRRRDEIAIAIDAQPVTADNYNSPEVKAKQDELKIAVEDLRDRAKAFVHELVEESGAMPIITAIDNRLVTYSTKSDPMSAYGSLAARLKEREELIKRFKAEANPEPSESWYIGVAATKSQMKKIVAAIEKTGATIEYAEKKKDS